jgi:hypothetical protein
MHANASDRQNLNNDPSIDANHIRKKHNPVNNVLNEIDIKKMELNLDDDIEKFSKFNGRPKTFSKKMSSELKYRTKKIIKKGSILLKNGNYYISPRSFLSIVSHNPKEYFSEVLNHFDETTYFVRNIDLTSVDRFLDLSEKPSQRISYPKKLFNKKYYDYLPMLLKVDIQTEVFKEGYLQELSTSSPSDAEVSSIAAGLGISFHLVTNYDFILNFGLSSFIHTGTFISGFEKTLYQSVYLGPEVLLKLGSIEGLNAYAICELSRSLYNNISDSQKTIDLFLRNSSVKFAFELKSEKSKSTWYTGAYYRLVESSMGRETSSSISKPKFRQNSNAYGLYFGRTFDFSW